MAIETFVLLLVSASGAGLGPVFDSNTLTVRPPTGPKTVSAVGAYDGTVSVLGSNDGVLFTRVGITFANPGEVAQTTGMWFRYWRTWRTGGATTAAATCVVSISAPAECPCAAGALRADPAPSLNLLSRENAVSEPPEARGAVEVAGDEGKDKDTFIRLLLHFGDMPDQKTDQAMLDAFSKRLRTFGEYEAAENLAKGQGGIGERFRRAMDALHVATADGFRRILGE